MDTTATTTRPGLTTEDLGNNESRSTGMTQTNAGWLALTGVESKTLKSKRGAVRWLAERCIAADGTRLTPLEAYTILTAKTRKTGKGRRS
jgi:hypothetical protein